MTHAKHWSVDIYIDEHEESRRTRAEARLHTGDRTDVRGVGTSSRNPRDREVPEIGDELAVSRALADLADQPAHGGPAGRRREQRPTHRRVTGF